MKILYLILPLMLLLTYIQMCLLEEKMLKKVYIYSVPGIIMLRALCHLIFMLKL